jgi:hypothetical protein
MGQATKALIRQMRARGLQRAASDATDPPGREADGRQAEKVLQRARLESITLHAVDSRQIPISRATHRTALDSIEEQIRRHWPWLGIFGASMIVVSIILSLVPN